MSTVLNTLTLSSTIFVTLSTAIPHSPPDIPGAIRGLSDCSQDVLFPLLGTSLCNPADFPCMCVELDRLGARKEVSDKCPEHVDEYHDFAVNTCGNAGVVTVTGTAGSESAVSTTTIPVTISTGGPMNVTSAPFNNGTAVAPTKTETAVLPSETSQGNGTSGGGSGGSSSSGSGSPGSGEVGPGSGGSGSGGEGSGSSPTQPENPEFSGAAVSEFGNGKMATFAGFIGMMWLAFAEL
ncbi:uncharacterized protein N0V89_008495 [Didymosphaeria variabile]|uniref:Extracellular membrane protein CFEM domain-containing protein n=1 Tax=Didymosphaeria variabile TaxID=1932322 RepID=A0A9W8XI85_9PLEO|nr:uncharacterized protein N0V89_008495 [Didymosphaeria variabile]KAJ4349876.1 hypothetical protein N0V89_008495 [Didymosphaeria variabile]